MKTLCPFALLALLSVSAQAAEDAVFADFEGTNYGEWKTEGTAFGHGPAPGKLEHQMNVDGFLGKGFVNSFHDGDGALGKLTSPEFKISHAFINFLIGGGGFADETCMNLLVEGKAVRTATGENTKPGGSEHLEPGSWDVHDLVGQAARIEIVDQRKGSWGHVTVDQIVFSDKRPPKILARAWREIAITQRFLQFPVTTGAAKHKVQVMVEGKAERSFDIELADASPEWWAPLDVGAWKGKTVTVVVEKVPEDSRSLALIEQGEAPKNAGNLYHEPLRPQLHFSPMRGWTNDPNGLAFFGNEYHLFFQHNPFGWAWGNMTWGHATSPDLVHWIEHGDVLHPDEMGPMFSGSAVVDWNNTSGFGKEGRPPLVLIYTAAGNPTTQCLAYSTDGRAFTKYAGNPVVKQVTGGNRDPKVMWHEPSQKWIMTFYVGHADPARKDEQGRPARRDTIQFLSSPNLKDWTFMSENEGFYECPDFFELPVDGDAARKKWVLTAASSDYMVGSFDGSKFTPETPKLKGQSGRGFYAAQTFSDEPKHRRIQIGWLQAASKGMAFNQAMSLPLELSLHSTPEGPRLRWQPAAELESLRAEAHSAGAVTLKEGDASPFAGVSSELLELRADFEPGANAEVRFDVRGVLVVYDAKKQEISVNGQRSPAPLQGGRQRLIIYVDRTAVEVFASDGLVYAPLPVIPNAENKAVVLTVAGSAARFSALDAFELKSSWK